MHHTTVYKRSRPARPTDLLSLCLGLCWHDFLMDDVPVLWLQVYGKYEKTDAAYFKHLHGSSWHGQDAKAVFWLEKYGSWFGAVSIAVLLTALLIASGAWSQRIPPGQLWYHSLITGAPRTGLVGVGTLPISTRRVHQGAP